MKTKKFLAFIISALLVCVLSAFSTGAYADDGADQNATITIGLTVAARQSAAVVIGFTKSSATTYTIEYDLAGGTGENPASYDINSGSFTLTNPTRKGYNFAGWTGTGLSEATMNVTIDGLTGNLAFTATWTIINYTITYDLDGGDVANANPATYTVESNAIILSNPEKQNCTFTGWKGTGIADGTMTVAIPRGSTGNRTYTATWAENMSAAKLPSLKTSQLILGSKIGVIFYFDIPEEFRTQDTFVIFDISGDKSNPQREFDAGFMNAAKTYYGFTCEINSVQMADKITAELHYKDNGQEKTLNFELTAEYYLNLGFGQEKDETSLSLLKAIADYGHYAQPPLARENKWTVGVEHAEMPSQTSASDLDEYVEALTGSQDLQAYAIEKGSDTSGIVVKYSLNLKSETQINMYFETPEGMSLTAYVNNEGESQVIENGRYKVNIAGISAHKLGDTYTITVKPYQGQTQYPEFTVKVSALSYVHSVLSTPKPEAGSTDAAKDTEMRRLAASLYRYFKATQAYINN